MEAHSEDFNLIDAENATGFQVAPEVADA